MKDKMIPELKRVYQALLNYVKRLSQKEDENVGSSAAESNE